MKLTPIDRAMYQKVTRALPSSCRKKEEEGYAQSSITDLWADGKVAAKAVYTKGEEGKPCKVEYYASALARKNTYRRIDPPDMLPVTQGDYCTALGMLPEDMTHAVQEFRKVGKYGRNRQHRVVLEYCYRFTDEPVLKAVYAKALTGRTVKRYYMHKQFKRWYDMHAEEETDGED